MCSYASMKKGLSVIRSSAIKEGTRHTRIDCPYNRRTVALELFDESQHSGVRTARIQRLPSFHHFCYLAESGWTLEGMFGIYVGQFYLHWQPRLAYAVTHASDFAHPFPEPATYSQLSNDTVSLLVLQALLRMEDVSRLSRFGTQVNDTRELIWGTGTAQYLSEQCLVRSSKQFLARQVQGEFGQQDEDGSGMINLKEERIPSFFFHLDNSWGDQLLLCFGKSSHRRDMKKYESNMK